MADPTDDDGNEAGNAGDKSSGANGNEPGNAADKSGDEPTPAPPANGDADILVTDQIRDEIRDGLELADFVVKNGVRRPDGRSVPPELIKVIKVTAGKVGLFGDPTNVVYIKASEWTQFELAYYALAKFSSPVTIETLRNTRNTGKGSIREASPAQKFTWLLWAITIGFALAVIAAAAISLGGDLAGSDSWTKFARRVSPYIKILIPYAYGGLALVRFCSGRPTTISSNARSIYAESQST